MKVHLYILRGLATQKYYTGITNNIDRRLQEHASGATKGGQIIGEFELVHTEEFGDYSAAREREKFFKSGQGRKWIKEHFRKHGPP